jgi:chromosome partitioning protein
MLGTSGPAEVIVPGVRDRLDLIVSTPAAFGLEAQLAGAPARETILARRLKSVTDYDAIVVDTSPAMNLLTYNALLYANDLIIPVAMDGMAIVGAHQTLAGVREIAELWPDRRLELLAVLPVAVNNTNATRAAFDALDGDRLMASRLYRRGIRQCIDVTYALTQRQTIWEYAPRSRAAEDYDAFVESIAAGSGAGRDDAAAQPEARQASI